MTTSQGTLLQVALTSHADTRVALSFFGEHAFASFVYSQGAPSQDRIAAHRRAAQSASGQSVPLLEEVFRSFSASKKPSAWVLAIVRGRVRTEVVGGRFGRHQSPHGRPGGTFSGHVAPKPPAKEEGELLVLTGDGKGVPLVKKTPSKCRCSKRRTSGLAIAAWPRWPARTRWIATCGRRSRSIVAALMHDDTVPPPADRPEEACFKRLFRQLCRARTRRDLTRCPAASLAPFAWTAEEAAKRWRPGQPVIRLMDGQKQPVDCGRCLPGRTVRRRCLAWLTIFATQQFEGHCGHHSRVPICSIGVEPRFSTIIASSKKRLWKIGCCVFCKGTWWEWLPSACGGWRRSGA